MMARVALLIVIASWIVMLVVLGMGHGRGRGKVATHRTSSRLGILLQGIGYAAVFGFRSRAITPFAGGWPGSIAIFEIAAAAMSISGAATVIWSQRTLGAQWSLTARLIEEHRLITSGPFAYVRHPIYSAMILMLVATGLALTTPAVVAFALVLYIAGTLVRVSVEERLMAEAFGSEWDEYRRRVAALIPGRR
jgi:protein-S-isoprenylcysteine O-methyltransferase Ste14